MRTKEIIKQEIKELASAKYVGVKAKKEKAKAQKRTEFLNECVLIVENLTDYDYLKSQLDGLIHKKKSISDKYKTWLKNTPGASELKSPKSKFNTEMGIKVIENQIKHLDYILG